MIITTQDEFALEHGMESVEYVDDDRSQVRQFADGARIVQHVNGQVSMMEPPDPNSETGLRSSLKFHRKRFSELANCFDQLKAALLGLPNSSFPLWPPFAGPMPEPDWAATSVPDVNGLKRLAELADVHRLECDRIEGALFMMPAKVASREAERARMVEEARQEEAERQRRSEIEGLVLERPKRFTEIPEVREEIERSVSLSL